VELTLMAGLMLLLGIGIAWYLSLSQSNPSLSSRFLQWLFIFNLGWYVPALFFARPAYTIRHYILGDEGIIVLTGWWVRSVRRIPFSSILALETRRDVLDRWLEIGTLDVQIAAAETRKGKMWGRDLEEAGESNHQPYPRLSTQRRQNYYRVRLAGLADVEQVAHCILQRLQQVRAPPQHLVQETKEVNNQLRTINDARRETTPATKW
jgi:membrane protein YdbS with pleckstrin-like domain